jgi:hypothetical protein
MSAIPYRSPQPEDGLENFLVRIAKLTSKRKPRPVVTPSGKRARGNFPSIKAPARSRYESLVEQDVLRVVEVSSTVHVLRTHPAVLALPGDPLVHYTPDAQLEWPTGGMLIETKASYFLTLVPSRLRLQEIVTRLAFHELHLVLIVESDVRRDGLQDELKALLRLRPRVGRYRPGIDPTRWDPLGCSVVDFQVERRWRAAQQECDELLRRVMRRDPGELIAAAL